VAPPHVEHGGSLPRVPQIMIQLTEPLQAGGLPQL
jgi:hypothetical protein